MKITHVIRGDDHKINTFKQKQIYEAMKWNIPEFAHIPLIHSEKGSKLSKRDGASTIDDYIKMGILSNTLRNYLLRLGWSHKDKEIFTLDESIKLFNLKGVGKSPSKLDMTRILSLNEYYIKHIDEKELFNLLKIYCQKFKKDIKTPKEKNIIKSMSFLKNKAKTLEDIYNNAQYILQENINISSEDLKLLDDSSKKVLKEFLVSLEKISKITKENLEKIINELVDRHKTNFKGVGQPLRIALTGSKFGPGIYDIILSLEKDEIIKRLKIV
jgi:glutamyl-tRNA synthetase